VLARRGNVEVERVQPHCRRPNARKDVQKQPPKSRRLCTTRSQASTQAAKVRKNSIVLQQARVCPSVRLLARSTTESPIVVSLRPTIILDFAPLCCRSFCLHLFSFASLPFPLSPSLTFHKRYSWTVLSLSTLSALSLLAASHPR